MLELLSKINELSLETFNKCFEGLLNILLVFK